MVGGNKRQPYSSHCPNRSIQFCSGLLPWRVTVRCPRAGESHIDLGLSCVYVCAYVQLPSHDDHRDFQDLLEGTAAAQLQQAPGAYNVGINLADFPGAPSPCCPLPASTLPC